MPKKEIIICDGPACTREKTEHRGWIDLVDWKKTNVIYREREYFFCSWDCLEAFANAKIIAPEQA